MSTGSQIIELKGGTQHTELLLAKEERDKSTKGLHTTKKKPCLKGKSTGDTNNEL